MNNGGNGAMYTDNTVTDFEKGDIVGRALANKNYRRSITQYLDKDNMEAELITLGKYSKELEAINDKSKKRLDLLKEIQRLETSLASEMEKETSNEKDVLALNEKIQKVKIKAAKDYLKVSNEELEAYEKQLEKINDLIKVQTKLNKVKWPDNLSKGLKDLSKEIGDLSKTLNIDKMVNGGTEALRTIRKNTMTSMNLSSNQFNEFKNNMLSEVRQLNGSIGGSLYGLDDIRWYMSNLNDLGIYSTSLAEQQVNAAIVGNKLLGMSVETQATFIKTMKRTDNKELLQQQNATIASLLKSNLEVSKEQLALAASNTANLLDQMSYLGINDEALERLGISATSGQAMVTSAFGTDTNTAVYNLLSDLAVNRYSSSRLFDGADKIINSLTEGDYGSALQGIINSDYYQSLARMDANSLSQFSVEDQKIAAMVRESNKLNWGEYAKVMGMGQEDAEKYLKDLQKNQLESLTWQERLENWFGTFFGALDWKYFVGLADMAFALYIGSKMVEIGKWIWQLKGKLPAIWNGVKGFGGTMKGIFTNMFGSLSSILTLLGGVVALAAAFTMFSNDWKRAKEAEIPALQGAIFGTRQGIENVIWNVGKYLLVGLGIALIAVAAGAAATIIAPILLIAGLFGLATGIFGSIINKDNDKLKSVGGIPSFSGVGGSSGPGVGGAKNSSYVTSGGINVKPWWITSRYGWRTLNGKPDWHGGIDLGKGSGTSIGANVAGKVVAAQQTGYNGGRGTYVSIKDEKGIRHDYFHMLKNSLRVKKGDYVNPGQIIGLMGNTGYSFGSHLHYGVNKNGKNVNPEGYITRNIMNATSSGNIPASESIVPIVTAQKASNADILGKFISADTKQKEATAQQYANYFATDTGVGGANDGGITGTVNKGFGDLINKLDELATKQEDQERVLAALTSRNTTALYRY